MTIYGPGNLYRGVYDDQHAKTWDRTGDTPKPVYSEPSSTTTKPAVIKNPYGAQFSRAVLALRNCETFPHLGKLLAHELEYKSCCSWATSPDQLFQLITEAHDLIALLAHPETGPLLESIRAELGNSAVA